MKPILLILEGVDRTGKTSVINEINKQTGYTPLILDRGPIGYKAYSELYNKENKASAYDELEWQLNLTNHLCIYLHASKDILYQRFLDTNEKELPHGIQSNLDIYNKYFEYSTLNKVSFNSGILTTKEIVEKIMELIN